MRLSGSTRNLHGEDVAAFVAAQHFTVVHPATFAQLGEQGGALLVVSPDADLIDRASDHFGAAVTGQSAETIVDFEVAACRALGQGDGVGA